MRVDGTPGAWGVVTHSPRTADVGLRFYCPDVEVERHTSPPAIGRVSRNKPVIWLRFPDCLYKQARILQRTTIGLQRTMLAMERQVHTVTVYHIGYRVSV